MNSHASTSLRVCPPFRHGSKPACASHHVTNKTLVSHPCCLPIFQTRSGHLCGRDPVERDERYDRRQGLAWKTAACALSLPKYVLLFSLWISSGRFRCVCLPLFYMTPDVRRRNELKEPNAQRQKHSPDCTNRPPLTVVEWG